MNENNCEIATTFLDKFFKKKILVWSLAFLIGMVGIGASAGIALAVKDIIEKQFSEK